MSAEVLWKTTSAHGHFTAMQARSRRARGLELHLRRLEAANQELFDTGLDHERIRWLIRRALRSVEHASVRVYIFEQDPVPVVMVTVREPAGISSPQRLQSVRYQRPEPHLKHLATGQAYYLRLARRNGCDDALLTAADGAISETTIANIGFFDESGIVWPDGPLLNGITMQLLERDLPEAGMPSRRQRIRLQDLGTFKGAFLTNARGIAAVSQLDDALLPLQAEDIDTLADIYASVPWDVI